MNIPTVVDKKRGCGWRKPGGMYLMGGGEWVPCGKLPVPLTVCKHCGAGIKVTRSLQRIDLKMLIEGRVCYRESEGHCDTCLINQAEYVWMMSVGEKFYKMPSDFMREALEQGISKRIHAIPRGFKVGESIVALAHHKAIVEWVPDTEEVLVPPETVGETTIAGDEPLTTVDFGQIATKATIKAVYTPGIFMLYRPTHIEYVVKGDETEEFLQSLVERGIQPVKVEQHVDTQAPLPDFFEEAEGTEGEEQDHEGYVPRPSEEMILDENPDPEDVE